MKKLNRLQASFRNHFTAADIADLDLRAAGAVDLAAAAEREQRMHGGYMAAKVAAGNQSPQLRKVLHLLPREATVDESGLSELMDIAGISNTVERIVTKIEAHAAGILRSK